MSRVITLLTIAFFLALNSCSTKPRYVLPKEKMEDLLYDIQLAQSVYNDYQTGMQTPEKKDALINDVLYKHNITQEKFNASLEWYADNINEYKKVNEAVIERLKKQSEALRSEFNKRYNHAANEIMPSFYTLQPSTPIFTFNIDSLKLKNIDIRSFMWRFFVIGASPNEAVEAGIEFIYPDTVIQEITRGLKNNEYTFKSPKPEEENLKNISGYVRLSANGLKSNVLLYNMNYIDSAIILTPKDNNPNSTDMNRSQDKK